MFKKTSDAVNNCIVFFIDLSSIFCEKNRKDRSKSLNNGLARKKRGKSTFGTPFFSKKSVFGRFLWVPGRLPRLPGRPGSRPESFKIFINFQLRLKTCPDGAPGGPREAPRVPPGTPRAQFCVDFAYQQTRKKMPQNVKETSQKIFKKLPIVVTNRTLRRRAASEPAPRNAHRQLPRRLQAQLFKSAAGFQPRLSRVQAVKVSTFHSVSLRDVVITLRGGWNPPPGSLPMGPGSCRPPSHFETKN